MASPRVSNGMAAASATAGVPTAFGEGYGCRGGVRADYSPSPSQWGGQLELSQKASRSNYAGVRPLRNESLPVAMQRELDAVEDKLTRQVMHLQEQSERLVDVMMQPLEAKVAAFEAKQPILDVHLAELSGGFKGMQEAVDAQTRRVDAMETRFRRWRKLLEDDAHAKHLEVKQDVIRSRQDFVSKQDLYDVVDLLKEELKSMVNKALSAEGDLPATRQELVDVAESLQQQLGAVEQLALGGSAEREITQVAESLRRELKLLAEKKAEGEETLSAPLLQELDKMAEKQRRSVADLTERVVRSEHFREDVQLDMKHFREELSGLKSRELGLEAVSRQDAERIAEQVFERTWDERAHLLTRPSMRVPFRSSRSSPRSVIEEETFDEATTNVDRLVEDVADSDQRTRTLAVMLDAATMRLDVLEERQTNLRQEVGASELHGRLERTWQAVEEEASMRRKSDRQLEELGRRVQALEQGASAEVRLWQPSWAAESAGGRTTSGSQGPQGRYAEEAADLGMSASLATVEEEPPTAEIVEGPDFRSEIAAVWRAIAELAELHAVDGSMRDPSAGSLDSAWWPPRGQRERE